MTVEVIHNFTSAVPDALDSAIVKPSHWNATHLVKAVGPCVLGINNAGAGQTVIEIQPVGALPLVLTWTGANLQWASSPPIADDAVTFSKIQNINSDRLIGRDALGVGDPEEIALDSTLEFTGSQVIRRAALTGDVTAAAGSNATTIANNAVSDAKLRDSAALSVIGRSVNSGGDPADIVAAANDRVLRRVGDVISFDVLTLDMAPNSLWTYAKIQNVSATDRLLGRDTAGAGVIEELQAQNGLEFTGTPGLGIANDGVTFARMQNITSDRLIGRDTTASGDPEEIALDSTLEFTGGQVVRRAALTGAIAASAGSNTTTMTFDVVIVIGDNQNVITTGVKGYLPVDFPFTITGWTLVADVSGSIVIDVWKDTYANYPPTVADTIAGSEKPTLSSVIKNQDLTLSTWTTSVNSGDVLGFNVDSASAVKQVTLVLRCTKTG
jgi:Repeat of unknown function (DUF5907)